MSAASQHLLSFCVNVISILAPLLSANCFMTSLHMFFLCALGFYACWCFCLLICCGLVFFSAFVFVRIPHAQSHAHGTKATANIRSPERSPGTASWATVTRGKLAASPSQARAAFFLRQFLLGISSQGQLVLRISSKCQPLLGVSSQRHLVLGVSSQCRLLLGVANVRNTEVSLLNFVWLFISIYTEQKRVW